MPRPKPRPDETLIKALVRAHRWRRKIESGQAKSITDLAEQEGVTVAYVCRLLPLSCLGPDIVEAILDGRQPRWLKLAEMLRNGPVAWEEQRGKWKFSKSTPTCLPCLRYGADPLPREGQDLCLRRAEQRPQADQHPRLRDPG